MDGGIRSEGSREAGSITLVERFDEGAGGGLDASQLGNLDWRGWATAGCGHQGQSEEQRLGGVAYSCLAPLIQVRSHSCLEAESLVQAKQARESATHRGRWVADAWHVSGHRPPRYFPFFFRLIVLAIPRNSPSCLIRRRLHHE